MGTTSHAKYRTTTTVKAGMLRNHHKSNTSQFSHHKMWCLKILTSKQKPTQRIMSLPTNSSNRKHIITNFKWLWFYFRLQSQTSQTRITYTPEMKLALHVLVVRNMFNVTNIISNRSSQWYILFNRETKFKWWSEQVISVSIPHQYPHCCICHSEMPGLNYSLGLPHHNLYLGNHHHHYL